MKFSNLILSLLLLAVTSFTLQSCMQWNGDIGVWFGSWYLESMYVDGKSDPDYKDNIMISFQGKIIDLAYIEVGESVGTWNYEKPELTLILGFDAGSGASLPQLFDPFPVSLHFPSGINEVKVNVTTINSKEMQWQYLSPQGALITYNFKKYP